MDAEAVLNLIDSYWYNHNFFNRKPTTSSNLHHNDKIPENPLPNLEIPSLPTIQTKSPKSKKYSSNSQRCDSASPNSILFTPKLQTIFSGKQSKEFEDSKVDKEFQETPTNTKASPFKGKSGIRRKKKGLSKSLSDLEFEELKGFIDLGFVFSEEDKDSILGSIIPGLQRLRKKFESNDGEIVLDEKSAISRPYLSEAWEVLEKKRRENSLLNWKVPVSNSETNMKDYLRFWAHTVAKAFTDPTTYSKLIT